MRFTDMERIILGAAIGSVIGGTTFFPLAMPVSLTIMLKAGIDSDAINLRIINLVFWILPLIGILVGGLIGIAIAKRKVSLVPFKNTSLSIMFWSILISGLIGLDVGFLFSGITLIGLGNQSTAIHLWIFSGIVSIVGVMVGVLIGFLVVFIRLAIIDHPFHGSEVH